MNHAAAWEPATENSRPVIGSSVRVTQREIAAATGNGWPSTTSSMLTALAAAWLLDGFAGFRLVTLYVVQRPAGELMDLLEIREDERGANVWLVLPNDESVLQGAAEREAIRCVYPVQAYQDLRAQRILPHSSAT